MILLSLSCHSSLKYLKSLKSLKYLKCFPLLSEIFQIFEIIWNIWNIWLLSEIFYYKIKLGQLNLTYRTWEVPFLHSFRRLESSLEGSYHLMERSKASLALPAATSSLTLPSETRSAAWSKNEIIKEIIRSNKKESSCNEFPHSTLWDPQCCLEFGKMKTNESMKYCRGLWGSHS